MKLIINTRQDLDAIAGTPEHQEFMEFLAGSITRKQDSRSYPTNYNQPDYEGDVLAPVWVDVEDLSVIESFGFTKSDFL